MAKIWDELQDGTLKLTVSPDQGGPASVFYGKTRDDILDKLAESQANANARIEQLRATNGKPNGHAASPPPQPVTEPKPMTANERMQAVSDLSNPATVDKAVTRVMESVIGPIDQFQRDREAERIKRSEEVAVAAAEEFQSVTPGFFMSDYNVTTLVNYMRTQGYPIDSVTGYQRAFAELSGAKLLQTATSSAPATEEPPIEPQERNAPTLSAPRAPARYSTGVRQQDISGTAPIPVKRLKWSREQIANMSSGEMRQHVNDPEFQACIDFYSKPQRKRVAV